MWLTCEVTSVQRPSRPASLFHGSNFGIFILFDIAFVHKFQAMEPALRFLWLQHAHWRFTAYQLCLVTLLTSEQCSQFERFCLQHTLMINETSSFKSKLISNAGANRFNHNIFWCLTFPHSKQYTSCYKLLHYQFRFWSEELRPSL